MTPETERKGRQFVIALLEEGQDCKNMLDNVRCLISREAVGKKNNVVSEAAEMLDVTPAWVNKWLALAGLKRTVVLKESA